MTKKLDCRGKACPEPVMQTKEILEKEKPVRIEVIVDNEAAKENVSRFLVHNGFQVSIEQHGTDFTVVGATDSEACEVMTDAKLAAVSGSKKILIMVSTDRLGHGDDTLGAGLLFNFLKTLKEMGADLWRIVFINNGVKLTADGAEALPVLQELVADGVSILVCGTCLSHFNLLGKKKVGETTNMLDIVTSMQVADSVITI